MYLINHIVQEVFSMGCVRSGEKAQKNENFASKSEKELWRKVQNTDQILEKCGERYCYVCYEG